MKPFLRSQLERYAQRLGELDFLLSREDIMGDMAQYRRISVEHAEVTQVAGRYARYQQREADLAGPAQGSAPDQAAPDLAAPGQGQCRTLALDVALHVLQHHDGVVHHQAGGHDQRHEREVVQ